MDLSETYVKMCSKATEIQAREKEFNKSFVDTCTVCSGKNFYDDDILPIWLPRQDQLQEMLGVDSYVWFKLCWEFVMDEPLPLSAEMVALELVMKRKFNKTWNGEDWI